MDIKNLFSENEKPLENLLSDGGFCSIFRTVGCIGDSLSSGEFEAVDNNGNRSYHDMYEYSWGQFIARTTGSKVYNFSRGGMTASEYTDSFAEENGFWDRDKICQAYIVALGVNDILNRGDDIGTVSDIAPDYRDNAKNFAGYYSSIIQRLKILQPEAKFFLMTMPLGTDERRNNLIQKHADLLYSIAEKLGNCYVLDFRKYAPVYDEAFREKFYLHGHMNACGYALTAKMVMSYIDYIIRHNMDDFRSVGFIPH